MKNTSIKNMVLSFYNHMPPFVRHLGSDYNSIYNFYKNAQWWSKEKIETWQLSRLKLILKYAYENTSGYRNLYNEAGIKLEDIKTLDDLKFLPLTDKALLRNNVKEFTVDKSISGHLFLCSTGGSSGIPFEFYTDFKHSCAEEVFVNSAWESFGWKPKDIGIRLRGSYLGNKDELIKKTGYHRYMLSSVFLTDDNYDQYINMIEKTKATFLHVYPSTITDLSHLILSHHDEGRLHIKYILLASENLYSWQEEIIKTAFPEAKLVSFYGHTERTIMAPWCEKEEKYHINPFYGFAEILDKDNKEVCEGEIGELVGTSFWMFGTLFIRYKTNDYVEKGSMCCEKCGRNYQVLNHIDGRLAEIIVGKTGRRISLTVFAGSIMHGKSFEHIKQFRFVQKEKGILDLKVVPNTLFDENDMLNLKKSIKDFLSDDFEFSIELVETLERTKRGKFTYLEQYLKVDRSDNV